ncbi:HD-GYP domain-containing protein [Pseudoalteromonas tunicata]|uniref:HD-GYP domain-containing protein n=1 Tax=Pseudoalteromonas tunicata TaxID=314281 RepID=UPI00273F8B70|nr:HD-GYP domain-containing protein [Pseudoalteromonas tunicata]MDP4982834.1 HD-GYP domain-containing protein [Pseudoalteromonas tunicata]MDP5212202.1 HD-GYP domain-containing protein [Pseudoalteromonas tunicata]
MLQEIKVNELVIGHFVMKIMQQDANYQLAKPTHIKSQHAIDHLRAKGVISVLIDPDKTLHQSVLPIPIANKAPSQTQHKHLIEEDVRRAKAVFDESKTISAKVFNDMLSGRQLDLKPVVEITNSVIAEIFKNSSALACVINIRAKDQYLLEHSVSVSVLISIFARYLELDPQVTHQLAIGGFLHDIGKIKIPDAILNKPGKLTDEEFEVMKTHVNHSITAIAATPDIPAISLEIAAQHHEKLDGQGYPFQLSKNDISLYGRMIAICDIFDALTANRVYKDGFSHIKSFSILRNLAKINHLDAELVDKFIKCMGVYPIGSLVELHSHKLAMIQGHNASDPTKPIVKTFYDVTQKGYQPAISIDLSSDDDYIIKGVRPDDFDLDMSHIVEFLLNQG